MAGYQPGKAGVGDPVSIPIPNRRELDMFNVNRDGWEGITQGLYDSNAYAAAGHPQLTFFQLPLGQGVGVGGAAKTFSDTNMNSAGQMPANQEFLIQSIEILFNTAVPTVAGNMPSNITAGVAVIFSALNDAYIFWRNGNLNLFIGSKSYCQEAPLMKFPPKAYFEIFANFGGSTTADTLQRTAGYAGARGRPYLLKAWLRLVSNQNFNVTLNWPEGVQAIVTPARVFVTLDGILYRRSQ